MSAALLQPASFQIDQFKALVLQGVDAWVKAGAILVGLLDSRAVTLREIRDRCPELNRNILERFEAIGRKKIHPRTLLSTSPAMAAIRRLPYHEQARAIDTPVTILRDTGDQIVEETVRVTELKNTEVTRVFLQDGHIRPLRDQREIILRARAKRRQGKAITKGNDEGFEPDKDTAAKAAQFNALADATPLQLLQAELDKAHLAMVEARRHLTKIKPRSKADDQITHALHAIGNLRYAANNNEF